MLYVFPAIFTKEDDGILVDFPDVEGCFTDGKNMTEAYANAEAALNLMLWHMEEAKQKLPVPSKIEDVKVPEGATIALVKADTVAYGKTHNARAVHKNVSIPSWLNTMAIARNINFSNALQNALMRELGVL